MKFSCSAFFLVCVLLLAVSASASYYRFMVVGDYIVEYEGECDPATETCFVGCEDEECQEVYYYSHVQKHAVNAYEQCGPDISECEEANVCLPEDTACSITYCSEDVLHEGETCEDLDESSFPEASEEDSESEEPSEEESEPMPL